MWQGRVYSYFSQELTSMTERGGEICKIAIEVKSVVGDSLIAIQVGELGSAALF